MKEILKDFCLYACLAVAICFLAWSFLFSPAAKPQLASGIEQTDVQSQTDVGPTLYFECKEIKNIPAKN